MADDSRCRRGKERAKGKDRSKVGPTTKQDKSRQRQAEKKDLSRRRHAERDAKAEPFMLPILRGASGEDAESGGPLSPHKCWVERRWLTLQRPIKPFLSSTFKDMRKERQFLREKVFTQLRAEAQSRGGDFCPIDLQWGVSNDESQSGKVIFNCLHYIDQVSPFFICILGERYGSYMPPEGAGGEANEWLRRHYAYASQYGYGWINQWENISITEMEIRQACFNMESKQWDTDKCPRAFFYFGSSRRVPLLIEEGVAAGQDRQALEHSYSESTHYGSSKLAQLKKGIKDAGFQITQFTSCDELGAAVMSDWNRVIEHQCGFKLGKPSVDSITWCPASQLQREWLSDWTFAAVRGDERVFVDTSDTSQLRRLLDLHVHPAIAGPLVSNPPQVPSNSRYNKEIVHRSSRKKQEYSERRERQEEYRGCKKTSIMVIQAEEGAPVTMLLAAWSVQLRSRLGRDSHADLCFVTHFAGATNRGLVSDVSSQGPVHTMLRRVVGELRLWHIGPEQNADPAQLSSVEWLCRQLAACWSLSPAVVVLDRLDLLDTAGETDRAFTDLAWLPVDGEMPAATRVVLSAHEGSSLLEALKLRSDTSVVDLKLMGDELASPREAIRLKQERRDVVVALLRYHCKSMDEAQIDQIVNSKLSWYYSVLLLLLDELRMFARHSQLPDIIDGYLEGSKDRAAVYQKVLKRWLLLDPIIGDGLKLLQVARDGLPLSTLLGVLSQQLGHAPTADGLRGRWAGFCIHAADTLYVRSDGVVDFASQALRAAVKQLFLDDIGEVRRYHRQLSSYLSRDVADPWQASALLWHLRQADASQDELLSCATTPAVFEFMLQVDLQAVELSALWTNHLSGCDVSAPHLSMIQSHQQQVDQRQMSPTESCRCKASFALLVGNFLTSRHSFGAARIALEQGLQNTARIALEQGLELLQGGLQEYGSLLVDLNFGLGNVFQYVMDHPQAIRSYIKALDLDSQIEPQQQHNARWKASTNLQICHAILTNQSQTAQARCGSARRFLDAACQLALNSVESDTILKTEIWHTAATFHGVTADSAPRCSPDRCTYCQSVMRKREILTDEYALLVDVLRGEQFERVARVQNSLAGIPCSECCNQTHQLSLDRQQLGIPAREGKPQTEWREVRKKGRAIRFIDAHGLVRLCEHCAADREDLYVAAMGTRRVLQGQGASLYATTLYHYGKLKLDWHSMQRTGGHLEHAIVLLKEALEVRLRCFRNQPRGHHLIAAVQNKYAAALRSAGVCGSWVYWRYPRNFAWDVPCSAGCVWPHAASEEQAAPCHRCCKLHTEEVSRLFPRSAPAASPRAARPMNSSVQPVRQLRRNSSLPRTQRERNFAVFTQLGRDLLLRMLRCYFRRCWDCKYAEHPWSDMSCDGELLLRGSEHFSVKLAGDAMLEGGCSTVVTTEDLSMTLRAGDFLHMRMAAQANVQVCQVVSAVRRASLVTDVTWPDSGVAQIYRPFVQCERNLQCGDTHQRTKILSGNAEEWGLGILAFVLTKSSHSLMHNAPSAIPVVKELVQICQSQLLTFEIDANDLGKITKLILQFVDLCLPDKHEECVEEIRAAQATVAGNRAFNEPESPEPSSPTRSNITSMLCQLNHVTDWCAMAEEMKQMGLVTKLSQ